MYRIIRDNVKIYKIGKEIELKIVNLFSHSKE